MTTIVEFILARLAERETSALAATWDDGDGTSRQWGATNAPSWGNYAIADGNDERVAIVCAVDVESEAAATHIALNDPKSVLADIAMQRKTLNHMASFFKPIGVLDQASRVSFDAIKAQYRRLIGYMAARYASHPDFREEWREFPPLSSF